MYIIAHSELKDIQPRQGEKVTPPAEDAKQKQKKEEKEEGEHGADCEEGEHKGDRKKN